MPVAVMSLFSASFLITGLFFLIFHRRLARESAEYRLKWERQHEGRRQRWWRWWDRKPPKHSSLYVVFGGLISIVMGLFFLAGAIAEALD